MTPACGPGVTPASAARAVIRHHARQHTSTETTAVTGTDTKDPR